MAAELSKKTIMAWRAFTATAEFRSGVDYLKEVQAPKVRGGTALELMEAGLKWGAYFEALNDLTEILCDIPKAEESAEDPGLEKI